MDGKWVTLYKYLDVEYVVENILNSRLYLNDGKNFNDPFEITVTNKDKRINQIDGLHILSLTNSYRNKLIWSHYTKSHKGVCLTVKVPEYLVYPVCYSSKRVYENSNIDKIILTSKKNVKKNINYDYSDLSKKKKIAYIKDKKWLYEKEYRIVFDENDENDENLIYESEKWYMKVKITNIYLGVNFEKNDLDKQKEIKTICKQNNVTIAQMVLSDSDYSIKVRREEK